MILNKRVLILGTICLSLYCLEQKNIPIFYSEIITCCSILFGFVVTGLMTFYSNQKINLALKEMKILDNFLEYNRNLLIEIIALLILTFSFQLFYPQTIEIKICGITLFFHWIILIYIYTIHMLYRASIYASYLLQLYKNTYSEYLDKVLRKHAKK